MIPLNITLEGSSGVTLLSNIFIDQYMKDANDSQIKVYLYLLRMVSANLPTDISEMADKFNDTEKDIIRCLKYWERLHLIQIEYDAFDNITGIHFADLSGKAASFSAASAAVHTDARHLGTGDSNHDSTPKHTQECTLFEKAKTNDAAGSADTSMQSLPCEKAAPMFSVAKPQKRKITMMTMDYEKAKEAYTLQDIQNISSDPSVKMLLVVAERYFERPLSPDEMKSLLFIYDRLAFSFELIDYLLQYCIEQGQKSMRYIEQIAYGWYEDGVTTERQAKTAVHKQENSAYAIMSYLGKSSAPADKELVFIRRWTNTYAFSLTIIEEACGRAVLATDHHRFEYADKILKSWHDSNVRTKEDILRLDKAFEEGKRIRETVKTAKASSAKTNYNEKNIEKAKASGSFCQIDSQDYDFDAIEKALLKIPK